MHNYELTSSEGVGEGKDEILLFFPPPLSALLVPLAEMSEDCRFAFRIIKADNEGVCGVVVCWWCHGDI